MDLKQILKANRPSLSEKTVYSYCSTLSSLYKKVFNSNDIYPVSADSSLPFAQHRDIFYLSGVQLFN